MNPKDFLTEKTTCVLAKGESVLTSESAGIRPMLDWIGEGRDLRGFSAADRIVGKAAAMLFVYAGITNVYAEVLSLPGKKYLEEHGITIGFGTLTERIINRRGDGLCPMEETVLNIDDASEAYKALKAKAEALKAAARAEKR